MGSFLEKVLLTKTSNQKRSEKQRWAAGTRVARSSLQALLPRGAACFGRSVGKEVEHLPGRKKKQGSGQYKSAEMRREMSILIGGVGKRPLALLPISIGFKSS